ncbi:hypothetical protein IT413_03765 [Candidatus Peregrinibacteria bacterium]|nr:hypothetical protein [Candidatus Peregrinibacteria bacterium]
MPKDTIETQDVFNVPDQICDTVWEMVKSPKFRQFLKYYNNLRKSQIKQTKARASGRAVKDSPELEDLLLDQEWQEVTSGDLFNNYDKAMDAYSVWKDLELRGKVEPISQVQTLVREMVDSARERSVDRILPEQEMKERFQKLGIDIQKVSAEWEHFYTSNKNFRRMLVQAGQMADKEKYSLPIPEISEGAMQAFEKAFAENRIDSVMIDDARLNNEDMYQAHFGKAIEAEVGEALPIAPQKVGNPKSAASIKKARPKHLTQLPTVRVVGYKFSPQGRERNATNGSYKFTDDLQKSPGSGVMEFTTLMNLIAKYSQEGGRKLSEFTSWDYYDGNSCVGGAQVSTILNNVNPDGTVLLATITNSSEEVDVSIQNVKPDQLVGNSFARPTIQSDLA